MSKHTPGKWTLHHDHNSWPNVVLRFNDAGIPVRTISIEGNSDVEANANAHLIAAAPDYYDAVEAMMRAIEESDDLSDFMSCREMRPHIKALRAAHAKAKGETP